MNKQAQLSEQGEIFIHLTQSTFAAVVRKSLEKVRSNNGDLFQSLRISSEQKNHSRYAPIDFIETLRKYHSSSGLILDLLTMKLH